MYVKKKGMYEQSRLEQIVHKNNTVHTMLRQCQCDNVLI